MQEIRLIRPQELKARLRSPAECALIDVREEGEFSESHLLLASCIPLSHLELRIRRMVPRNDVFLVLVDGEGGTGGLADRAARLLGDNGYSDVHVLAGGTAGWQQAGYELFSGINVPSKAFGEIVEHQDGTPSISADELSAMLKGEAKPVILDSRTFEEYALATIPGAISCPGGELVHRFKEAVASPDRLVVVNCAGRTRSIIGAQSLIAAGVPNRVVALRNGVMGWRLAGHSVEANAGRTVQAPAAPDAAALPPAVPELRRNSGLTEIDARQAAAMVAEPQRTTYLIDIRSPAEYRSGHLPDAVNAPGGQLIQATDAYMATRNARIVLVDDDGTRASMTGWWLARMGWPEIYACRIGQEAALVSGPMPRLMLAEAPQDVRTISAADLARQLGEGNVVVLDLSDSLAYRRGHIPGAWFVVRARLRDDLPSVPIPPRSGIVVVAPDDALARLAARDVAGIAGRQVAVLEGGMAAWIAQGRALESGHLRMASAPTDVWYRPSERPSGVEAAMQEYLSWEIGLVERVVKDGDAPFLKLIDAGGQHG
ncbi:MAG: rhodanese-like domain-containing protein [Reyranellaceae bacterium]